MEEMENSIKMTNNENIPVIDVNLEVLNRNQSNLDTIYERKVQPQLDDIIKMKSKNFTDKEMCKILDISTTTLYHLRKLHPELQGAYQMGIDMLVNDVERSAMKEAIGYEYTEDAIHPKLGVVKVNKYARGNASMQKYILSNKRPKSYTNKQVVSTDKSNVIDLTALKGLKPLELKSLIDLIANKEHD